MRYLHDGPHRALLDALEAELAGATDLARFELRIELDPARFERAFDWERRAYVVHETAHAWRRHRGVELDDERECYEADLCVLGWGVGVWFLDARGAMLDTSYREVLDVAAGEGREKAEPLYDAWATKRDILARALGHFRT
jgi:hypothetical protein